jgi:hypothetical protein
MSYRIRYVERILPEFQNIASFKDKSVTPEGAALGAEHVSNGNIISESYVLRSNDPYTRDCEIIFKDRNAYQVVKNSFENLPPSYQKPGFERTDLTEEEI